MVILTLDHGTDQEGHDRCRPAAAHPQPAFSVQPATTAPGPDVTGILRPDAMEAVALEPGERASASWVARMKGPYTSRARHLVQRAQAGPSRGTPPVDRHPGGLLPTWALEAAACQRGALDALGVDLPTPMGAVGRPGAPVLIQHLVPAISLGWYVVTTVHATAESVLLLEGSYARDASVEAPFPVRWT